MCVNNNNILFIAMLSILFLNVKVSYFLWTYKTLATIGNNYTNKTNAENGKTICITN